MAGGGYPAAYRDASRPLRVPSGAPLSSAANAARVPGSFPGLKPANSNAAGRAALGASGALRIAGRLLPLVGYGLLLYDLWRFWNDYLAFQQALGLAPGWQRVRTHCGGSEVAWQSGLRPDGGCTVLTTTPGYTCATLQSFLGPVGPEHSQVTTYECQGQHPVFTTRVNYRPSFGYQRMSGAETWRDPNEIAPRIIPTPDSMPLPGIMPQVLPEAAPPPGTPTPDPVPVPWAFVPWLPTESPTRAPIRGPSRPVKPRPNPYRYPRPRPTESPAEREERRRRAREREEKRRRRGPRPPRPTRPPMTEPRTPPLYIPFPEVPPLEEEETGALPGPGRDVYPEPGLAPELVPSSRLELRPGHKPKVSRTPHRRQRPGRKTRERKVILSWGNHLVFARGVNAATEFCDFVDAIYQSLSQEARNRIEAQRPKVPGWFYRSKGMDLPCHEKAWAVFWNLQHADLNQAVKNLVANQIIDFVFGRAGKAAGEVGRAIGSPVGLGSGPAL